MKLSRFAAGAAALMMGLSTVPAAAAAEAKSTSASTKESDALSKVILDVKSRVDIPASLDKFEYDTQTKYGTDFYTLTWYKKDKIKYSWGTEEETVEEIKVYTFDGFIASVDHYKHDSKDRIGFPKLSADKQAEAAKKYLYKVNPKIKGTPVIERTTDDTVHSSRVRFKVSRPISGIPFDENSGEIVIDKDTGELISMDLRWWNAAEFPDASKRITPEKASELFKERKPLAQKYNLFTVYDYDEETGESKSRQFILPVYYPSVSGQNEIDAITGEYTKLYEDRNKYSYTDAYNWSSKFDYYDEEEVEDECAEEPAYAAGSNALTDAERGAVEDESKYKTYDALVKIIKDDPFIVWDDALVNTGSYISSYTDIKGSEQPLRVLDFSFSTQDTKKDGIRLHCEMDAVTGEIISFRKTYSYGKDSPNKNMTPATEKKVKTKANAAAVHFLGDKAYEYRITGGTSEYNKDVKTGNVYYTRYVNDLSADFDTVEISVDSRDEVLSFSYTYHDMTFPAPKPVGEDKAYEMLFDKMKPDLYYTGFTDLQLRPHTYLTYSFDANYMINMNTGKRIDPYSGEDYYKTEKKTEEEKVIAYSDIKGHKYEKEIQTLLDCGIYCTDAGKLDPDGAITVLEFTTLWDKVYQSSLSVPYKDKWDSRTQSYIPNKDAGKPLTRGEIAKIYVRQYASEYYDAAAVPGIYKSPCSDVKENSPYIGYIIFARAAGLADEKKAAFGENTGISRADCLKLAYDYLAGENQAPIYEVVRI